MKNILCILLLSLSVNADEIIQNFAIHPHALDISKSLKVRKFNPQFGTLLSVTVNSQWKVWSFSDDYDVTISLECPTYFGVSITSNHFIGANNPVESDWGLGIWLDDQSVELSDYIGHGLVEPFEANFVVNSSAAPVYGSLHLTVIYEYIP